MYKRQDALGTEGSIDESYEPEWELFDLEKDPYELNNVVAVSYTHLRAHETVLDLVCRLLLEKKKKTNPRYVTNDIKHQVDV